jgi:hypothetical protein
MDGALSAARTVKYATAMMFASIVKPTIQILMRLATLLLHSVQTILISMRMMMRFAKTVTPLVIHAQDLVQLTVPHAIQDFN